MNVLDIFAQRFERFGNARSCDRFEDRERGWFLVYIMNFVVF